MANIKLKCPECGQEFEKRKAEYNRSQRRGMKSYCSRKCSSIATRGNLNRGGNSQNLNTGGDYKSDEFTQFKWFLRCVKQRRHKKEYNIDLPYLKQLWEEQSGVCPLTGWELTLPKNSSVWDTTESVPLRASLDRIDSNKGYVKGNVRYISVIANYCKNTLTDQDVFRFCEAVVKKQNLL